MENDNPKLSDKYWIKLPQEIGQIKNILLFGKNINRYVRQMFEDFCLNLSIETYFIVILFALYITKEKLRLFVTTEKYLNQLLSTKYFIYSIC